MDPLPIPMGQTRIPSMYHTTDWRKVTIGTWMVTMGYVSIQVDPNRNLVKRRSAPRPSSLQQNGEIVISDVNEEENGGKKDLTSKIMKVLTVHEDMCPFTGLAGDIDSSEISFSSISRGMEKIGGTPKLKAVVVVYCIRARDLTDKLFMEEMVMESLRGPYPPEETLIPDYVAP
ncbi:hypothetical protein PPACK8108_LOCUS4020 [Phakopsora pachyrhizi]|uniref:Uncharacterized protein n=1 Tax=Phakopsora pachyrhizi TaxID=170000 RepID=A0AAV0ALM4_PHAPC|nr:hypothetical protein PPACK8108_LOCUS4020 [Phakopsora pachyrhizi]